MTAPSSGGRGEGLPHPSADRAVPPPLSHPHTPHPPPTHELTLLWDPTPLTPHPHRWPHLPAKGDADGVGVLRHDQLGHVGGCTAAGEWCVWGGGWGVGGWGAHDQLGHVGGCTAAGKWCVGGVGGVGRGGHIISWAMWSAAGQGQCVWGGWVAGGATGRGGCLGQAPTTTTIASHVREGLMRRRPPSTSAAASIRSAGGSVGCPSSCVIGASRHSATWAASSGLLRSRSLQKVGEGWGVWGVKGRGRGGVGGCRAWR